MDETPIGDSVAEKPPDGVSETLRSRGHGNLQSRFSIHKRIPNRQTPLNGRFHRSNHATGAARFFRVQCSPVQLANCLSFATRGRLRLQLQLRTKWTFSTQTARPEGSTAESRVESCWLPLQYPCCEGMRVWVRIVAAALFLFVAPAGGNKATSVSDLNEQGVWNSYRPFEKRCEVRPHCYRSSTLTVMMCRMKFRACPCFTHFSPAARTFERWPPPTKTPESISMCTRSR